MSAERMQKIMYRYRPQGWRSLRRHKKWWKDQIAIGYRPNAWMEEEEFLQYKNLISND